MELKARRLAAMSAAAVLAASAAWAQGGGEACALMSQDEFEALTGKTEYTDPTAMPWGEASVCGYDNGQILLFTGPDSPQAFERLLSSFGQANLPREPVEGLGEGAFAMVYEAENRYQDHGAFVVFGAGPPTVAVTVYAEEGEPAEAALPQAKAVAQAIAAKLP